jgi:putative ABC transport system permease protein
VFSGDVARRRKEIGLRLAIGGSAAGVIVLLLTHALRRAGVGIVAGLVLALLMARSMRALLFGISASDPLSMLTVTVGAVLLTSVATLIPAIQALRASPLAALRDE